MAHSIGKTIAELRKANGWTQVQLAEKLGVSDKAVSKWESEGGFPEITQLPALASFFDTTIDFLLTGKNIEAISLDDMDTTKRRYYLIERDDAEKYIKYGYVNTCFNMPKNKSPNEKIAIKEIIKNKSYKIFNACVDAGMCVSRDNRSSGLSKADILNENPEHFEELIKFACLAGSVKFFEQIDFREFSIKDDSSFPDEMHHTFQQVKVNSVRKSTLQFIFNNSTNENIINYISTYIPFCSQNCQNRMLGTGNYITGNFYFLEQEIIEQLYRTKRFDLLDKYLQDAFEDSLKTIAAYSKCEHNSYTSSSLERGYLVYNNYWAYILGKVILISKEIVQLAISNIDKVYASKFIKFNKKLHEAFWQCRGFELGRAFVINDKKLEELLEAAKKEKRVALIKNDNSISDHERLVKLAEEDALSLDEAIVANDYDAFILLSSSERNKIDPEYLSRNGVQDIRFYIYAVNVSDNTEYLNQGLKNILENYPERYDIQDVLLSAGAIIDGNVAMTNILKQNVLILNKQVAVENSNIEVNESVTNQELLDKVAGNQLQYVIINATIQMERKLKVHIVEQIDLSDMIDKALNIGLIDAFNCKLLHKLRMARNSIMHAGNKSHYTADIVKMWVEAVYSIK